MTISALMPETRAWEKQGVTITYLCFDTMFSHRVNMTLREKYLYPAPTADDPERQMVPTPVYMFYKAMPLITDVVLADGAPQWGHILKEAIENPNWLADPVADFMRFERRAPDTLLLDCYEGYQKTREQVYAAPPELQDPEPQAPIADPDTGEVDRDKENFTASSTNGGGKSLTITPSRKREKRSASNRQTAKPTISHRT